MTRTIENRSWVERLRTAIAVARVGDDPEGVHQLRVGCRRLAAWLDLDERRIGRDDLKWLRDAAGHVRDLDVLLERDVPPAMRRWIHAQHRKARRDLVEALDAPRTGAILALFDAMAPVRHAATGLHRLLDRASKAIDAVAAGSPDELHRVRRKLRPIRYALEWQGADSSSIEIAQDELGALSDAVMLHRMTALWGGDPAREAALVAELEHLARTAVPTLPGIKATLEELR